MKIDLCIDVDRNIAGGVTRDHLNECVLMALSCLAQGKSKGIGMHPGMTIEWNVTRDEDGAL